MGVSGWEVRYRCQGELRNEILSGSLLTFLPDSDLPTPVPRQLYHSKRTNGLLLVNLWKNPQRAADS
jgi:hypothetical protein